MIISQRSTERIKAGRARPPSCSWHWQQLHAGRNGKLCNKRVCGFTNVQGRYVNGGGEPAANASTTARAAA